MGFFNNFPYTNFHELNVDWVMSELKKLKAYIEQYTAINNVSYAGVWNITKQYPQWSIVTNGDKSYLSKEAVPAGIDIDNEKFWLQLADLDPRIAGIINRLEMTDDYSYRKIYLDVTKFGVVPDGVMDNREKVELLSENFKYLYFPKGEYLFTDTCRLHDINIFADNAILKGLFEISGKCKIQGVHFVNYDTSVSVTGGEIAIENCAFSSGGASDVMFAVHDGSVSIANCNFDGGGNKKFGVWCDPAGFNNSVLNIASCNFNNFILNAIFSSAVSCSISSCVFTNCHKQTQPNGGGCVDFVGKDTQGINTVENCVFKEPGGASTSGIESETSAYVTIDSNYIDMRRGNYGIAVQESKASISNNIIIGKTAIWANSSAAFSTFNNHFKETEKNIALNNPYMKGTFIENDYSGKLLERSTDYLPIVSIVSKDNVLESGEMNTGDIWRYTFVSGVTIKVATESSVLIGTALNNNFIINSGENNGFAITANNGLLEIRNDGSKRMVYVSRV